MIISLTKISNLPIKQLPILCIDVYLSPSFSIDSSHQVAITKKVRFTFI